jgi:hypothetical protein
MTVIITADTQELLKKTVIIGQYSADFFEELACECKHSNGHGGCRINTADGCRMLGCPLTRGTK